MKLTLSLVVLLALAAPVAAQDTLSSVPVDSLTELPTPTGLADTELARSRRCVPVLARLDMLNTELAPLRQRSERLRALVNAVALEDTARVAPFAMDDPVEVAVRDWFEADQILARQYLATSDTTIQGRRTEEREQIVGRLRDEVTADGARAEEAIAARGDVIPASDECLGVMLVRSVVLEACAGVESILCAEAGGGEPSGRFRLMDEPEDLWGVGSMRAWSRPSRLGFTAQGTLSGASTNASVGRGNVGLLVGLEPIVQDRTAAVPEDLDRLQASLDSLGLSFDHPRFLLVPGLAIGLEVGRPLGGESFYFLHFGDLSDPGRDVIWSAAAAAGAPISYMAPIRKDVLDRLVAGEPISLTAVRFPQPGVMEGDAVYILELPAIGQSQAFEQLLEYMSGGQMQADFTALVPPPPAGG